jgi:uncharacterized protein YndB with AHSA1/START domain
MTLSFDPARDLAFSRVVPLTPAELWRGWTDPALLTRWFCPKPWMVTEAEIDTRPGGLFRTVMQGPAGERVDNIGCWLEVEPPSRLVWTDALGPGFRPSAAGFVTVTLRFDPAPGGTLYAVRAQHKDSADRDRHAAMGFEQGWVTALDQLVALLRP